jgi:hypothetical protein
MIGIWILYFNFYRFCPFLGTFFSPLGQSHFKTEPRPQALAVKKGIAPGRLSFPAYSV